MTWVLAGSAAATGALAGFAAGVVALVGGVPPPSLAVAVLVAAVAMGLDRAGVAQPAVRRQVPQAWGRIFPPATAAALYGARLGVGPLTIGASWTWWGAAVLAAAAGPLPSVVVGAAFGAGRVAAMALAARLVPDPPPSG